MAQQSDLIALLAAHQGVGNGIRVDAIARALKIDPRTVRRLVSEARAEGVAIAAHPGTGYFIARTPDEIEMCCAFLRSRAMHTLGLEARLRKIPLPELIGQLRLKT